jgi:predicted PolB exonuclease-like 3'-5' exonuclease
VIIFDTETVADLAAARVLLGLDADELSDHEVRRLLGARYAKDGADPSRAMVKTPLHRIVALSMAIFSREGSSPWRFHGVQSRHVGNSTEQVMLARFLTKVSIPMPAKLVTFNGSGFDVPLLRYRAFAHGLSAPRFAGGQGGSQNYFYRYGQNHLDLCEVMSSYGASGKPSLAEVATILRVPAKVGGFDGADVELAVLRGEIQAVSDYCETDVVGLALVWLRWMLLCEQLAPEGYTASCLALAEGLDRQAHEKPHLLTYIAAARRLATDMPPPSPAEQPAATARVAAE